MDGVGQLLICSDEQTKAENIMGQKKIIAKSKTGVGEHKRRRNKNTQRKDSRGKMEFIIRG